MGRRPTRISFEQSIGLNVEMLGDELGAVDRERLLAEDEVHRVAGDGVYQEEDDRRHRQHHRQGHRDPLEDEYCHSLISGQWSVVGLFSISTNAR